MSTGICITGCGVAVPEFVISNQELCDSFNEYVRRFNDRNGAAIASGEVEALKESSPEFIVKASGIQQRHVHEKAGTLDPERMCPNIPERPDEQLSLQAEFAITAADRALAAAGRSGTEIDMILLASSNLQRMYPAVGMEVQGALGASGFAYDLSIGCSSATFPLQIATDALRTGSAKRALLVNPEIMCGHLNWRDRDSHFIFGDAATAIVLERTDDAAGDDVWEILGTRLMSTYSTAIRNNGGYLNRCAPDHMFDPDKLFYQQGRKVFKEVVPMASEFITSHVQSLDLDPTRLDRYWLHQANANMNRLIARRVLGAEATPEQAPQILDRYANTASCGSIIAFDHNHRDLKPGSTGVLCSFGAGYSIGSVVVRRLR